MTIISTLDRIFEWFGLFGWLELFAALMVAFGCLGEFWILANKLTQHIEPIGKTANRFWRIVAWFDSKLRPLFLWLKINGRKIPKAKEDLLERLFVILVAIGVTIEVVCLPFSLNEVADLNFKAGQAYDRAANAESNNFVLSIELEKLRHPRIITTEQREKFIEILCGPLNASKIPIIVIYAGNDRPTEQFAFQIRKILDEAGYGFAPSKYQTSVIPIPASAVCVTDAVPHIDLPVFTWMDATLVKMKSGSVSPLPESSNPIVEHPGEILHTEQPFTDREPNIIALFSGSIPPKNTMPSVNIAYPVSDNPNRGFHYIYSQTKDTNAILYGVCEVFHDIGITIGENKATGIIPDGYVGFFIPSQ